MYDNTGQFFARDKSFLAWFLRQSNQSCKKLFAHSSTNTTKPAFWLYCCSHKHLYTRVLHDFSMRTLVMGMSVSDSMIMVALNAWTWPNKTFLLLFYFYRWRHKQKWEDRWNFGSSIFASQYSHMLYKLLTITFNCSNTIAVKSVLFKCYLHKIYQT